MEKYNFIIEDENNCRLDKVIALKMKDLSRTQIQEMISNGSVLVNGKATKAGYKTKLNDQIEIMMEDNVDLDIEPEDIPLKIVYEDKDVIVVDTAGISSMYASDGGVIMVV